MKIRYAAKTDVGMKRTHNEDYFSLIEDEQLFLVADGMGGHASGEVASKMAAETIGELSELSATLATSTAPAALLAYFDDVRRAVDAELARRLAPPTDDPGRLVEAMC